MTEYRCDLHIHSCLSPCGDEDMTPANIVGMAAIKGLDVIALTDHNSCKNCPAVMKFAEKYGVTVIPGMELTTQEEVHVQLGVDQHSWLRQALKAETPTKCQAGQPGQRRYDVPLPYLHFPAQKNSSGTSLVLQ